MKPSTALSILLFIGLSAFSHADEATQINGDKVRISLVADKSAAKEGDAVVFKATISSKPAGKTDWFDTPPNPYVTWKVSSTSGSIAGDPRVTINKSAATVTVRNLRATDNSITVTATLQYSSATTATISETVTVPVKVSGGGGTTGGGSTGNGGAIHSADPDAEPKPVLPADFVHAIRGAGKFSANTRVELTVAFKPNAEGSKGVTIDWYFHGKLLKPNQPKLVIAKLTTADTGTYTAKVTRKQDGKKDEASAAVTIAK